MVAIYVRWIKAGKMTLDQVPDKWRRNLISSKTGGINQ